VRPTAVTPLCLAALLCAHASADVIHVDRHGSPGSYPTIGQGIAAASEGDTVLVGPGVYWGDENRGLDFEGRNLSVIASGGPDSTMIDCQGQDRAFYFDSGEDSTSLVSGFTIKDGQASWGGAIVCTPASPTLRNLVIVDCGNTNYTYGGGGLAFRGSTSRSLVEGIVLLGSQAGTGGAIYCEQNAGPTIRNCTIVGSSTYNGGGGAGIGCWWANPTIERTIVAHSIEGSSMWCDGGANPITRNCLFFDNPGGDTPCGDAEENLFEDPQLCDAPGSDVRPSPGSPCLPANNAYGVLIGAVGEVGCEPHPCRTMRVPDDYLAIGEALAFAAPCDTVLVAPGGYKETWIEVPWGVTCKSSGGPDLTIVDAYGGGNAFSFGSAGSPEDSSAVTVLEGFTITGATSSAIRVAVGSPEISDCIITGNSAGTYGGGLRCYGGGNPTLKSVVFSNNSTGGLAGGGGAVYCTNGTAPSFSSTVFFRNSAYSGGAVRGESGSAPSFVGCTFADNEAELGACVYSSGGFPTVTRSVLAFSRAGRAVSCAYGAEPTLTENVVFGNAHGDTLCGIHLENIFEDPQFCDLAGGDLRVGPESPCLPENNPAGIAIGALPEGNCTPAGCEVLTVPGDFATISEAAAAAGFCDTILVSAGVYMESGIHLRGGIALLSVSGADSTVIDAGGAGTAITVGYAEGAPLRGSRATIRGFTLRNAADSALRANSANMVIDSCAFTSNSGVKGAAIQSDLADIEIADCRFEGNEATGTTFELGGGAIHCRRGVLELAGCVFWDNTATRGGSIYCESSVSMSVRQCTFVANGARWGAAVFVNDSYLETSESILFLNDLGRIVHCSGTGDALTVRCLLYANSWGGEICGTTSDILVEEPGFCDEAGGDFRLCVDSICLPGNNPFGVRIGALGPGECPCPEFPCAILHVPAEYASIGEAVAHAVRCDTVLVQPGLYNEQNIVLPWGIAVVSAGGPEVTTIDAAGSGSIFLVGDAGQRRSIDRASIRGFTLTGATDSAIRVLGRSPEISECVFTGNSAAHGAGVYCEGVGAPIISSTAFIGNTAELGGGGISCESGCSPRLTDVTFDGNVVTSTYYSARGGGGMACYGDCSPTLTSCLFTSNSAVQGGGLSCSEGGLPVLHDVTFEANSAEYGGGLVYQYDVAGTIEHSSFIDNAAEFGGGIRLTGDSSPTVSFVTLTDNFADRRGGAVWTGGQPTFEYCTLSDNEGDRGAGFYFAGDSPLVTNTVIAYGEGLPVYRASGSPTTTRCVVFGHSGGDSLQGYHAENIFADPRFCDRTGGDYTVDAASPCVAENNFWGEAVGAWDVGCGGPVFHVYPDGSGSAPTIQAAVDSCTSGGTIFLGPGVYQGAGNRGVTFQGKSIVLASISGPGETVLDCDGGDRGFTFVDNEDSLAAVVGVTIRNGTRPLGGGVLFDGADVRFENCVVESCSADRGGGVACVSGASPVLQDVTVDRNDAREGGGCYSASNSSPVFRRCSFYGNSAAEEGGAVFGSLCQMALESVTIAGNHADDHGAGVYLRYCPATLFGVIIAFNTQKEGVYSEGPCPPDFLLCSVFGNAGGDSLCGTVGYGCESVDPLFCDFVGGDLTLCANSLCIRSGPPDGHIGRYGAACAECAATGVEDEPGVTGAAVSWSSPNPSRGDARIHFSIPEFCNSAVLGIYNLKGQRLRHYELSGRSAGPNEVVWDGRNDVGIPVGSGVYFYCIESCGTSGRGKLVLLR
jgi:predicted outer membrane repeat protein